MTDFIILSTPNFEIDSGTRFKASDFAPMVKWEDTPIGTVVMVKASRYCVIQIDAKRCLHKMKGGGLMRGGEILVPTGTYFSSEKSDIDITKHQPPKFEDIYERLEIYKQRWVDKVWDDDILLREMALSVLGKEYISILTEERWIRELSQYTDNIDPHKVTLELWKDMMSSFTQPPTKIFGKRRVDRLYRMLKESVESQVDALQAIANSCAQEGIYA